MKPGCSRGSGHPQQENRKYQNMKIFKYENITEDSHADEVEELNWKHEKHSYSDHQSGSRSDNW